MARPTSPDPKSEHVIARFTVGEKQALTNAASHANMNVSEYVRDCVRRVADADARKAHRLKHGSTP